MFYLIKKRKKKKKKRKKRKVDNQSNDTTYLIFKIKPFFWYLFENVFIA